MNISDSLKGGLKTAQTAISTLNNPLGRINPVAALGVRAASSALARKAQPTQNKSVVPSGFSPYSANTAVSANTVSQTTDPLSIGEPMMAPDPYSFVDNLAPVAEQSTNYLTAQEQEFQKQRDDVLGRILNTGTDSSQTIYDNSFDRQGGNTNLKQLQDETLKLAQMQAKFRSGAQTIRDGQGQSQVFAGNQLQQLSNDEAVQVGNQALIVQALQGNVSTARQIALDTVQFAQKDREVELDNLLRQYNALSGRVSGAEAKQLEAEKQKWQTEKDNITYYREQVSEAIKAGATPDEMQKLTDPSLSIQQKIVLAQTINARRTSEAMSATGASVDAKAVEAANAQIMQADNAITAATDLTNLIGSSGFSGAVGFGVKKNILSIIPGVGPEAIPGTQRADFEAKFNQLKGAITLPNLQQMRGLGAMSDREFATLSSASTALSLDMTEQAFKTELAKVLTTLDNVKKKASMKASGYTDEEIRQIMGESSSDYPQQTSSAGFSPLARSIVEQESGGRYDAVGIPTKHGRALGKYQIIPKFHFAKIGLNPNSREDQQKYLASPQLQDKLFAQLLGELEARYNGNPQKIAAAYYGGDGAARIVGTPAADKPQAGGMPSINQYVRSVVSRIS